MALGYGVARERERAALGAILGLSFGFPADDAGLWFAKAGYDQLRVIRDGDTVLGGLILIPMGHFIGGRSVPCVAIAGVGVSPGARRHGVASEMMRRALRELHGAGVPLSSLYPASIPLYRRAGYELAGATWEFTVSARELPRHELSLTPRPFEAADERQVREVYAAYAAGRNGWLDRGPYVWERTRRVQDGKAAVGHVLTSGRRVEGYVFHRVYHRGHGFDLRVSDMAARSPAAHRDLMAFLASHKSIADDVSWFGGVDDPWLTLLPDRHYQVRLHHHWMMRLVDVAAALRGRGYPRGLSTSVTLDVRDDVLKRQSGSYRLRVADGVGHVTRVSRGGLRLDVRTLAALYTSQLDLGGAARLGLVQGSARAIDQAAPVFAGPAPSVCDMY